jgi:hypothetical protein
MNSRLTKEQISRACRLFHVEGKTYGQVAKEIGCGLYDIFPWLGAATSQISSDQTEENEENPPALQPEGTPDV